jgi:hypothetical protein
LVPEVLSNPPLMTVSLVSHIAVALSSPEKVVVLE